jgi:hypothetical protein
MYAALDAAAATSSSRVTLQDWKKLSLPTAAARDSPAKKYRRKANAVVSLSIPFDLLTSGQSIKL